MQSQVHGDKVLPSGESAFVPFAEDARFEHHAVGVQERQEARGKSGAVGVEEVAELPVRAHVDVGRVPELLLLVAAILACAADYFVHKARVRFGGEVLLDVGGALEHVLEVACVVADGEHDGVARGLVVDEVDQALAEHAFPCALGGHAFGGGAAPEEHVLLGNAGPGTFRRIRTLSSRDSSREMGS